MPRKKTPKLCACGCGGQTKGGEFLSGHDAKLYSAIINHVGGTAQLRRVVEAQTGREVIVRLESGERE